MKNLNRRRQVVIDKAAQSRIVLAVSWPPALCLAFTAALLGLFCTQLHDEAISADVELPSIVPVFITALCFLLIGGAFVLFNAVSFSHRIAGPMYRIKKTFEAFRAGDIHIRANVRDRDFLTEAADEINDFLDWLEEHPPQGVNFVDADEVATKAEAAEDSNESVTEQKEATETSS